MNVNELKDKAIQKLISMDDSKVFLTTVFMDGIEVGEENQKNQNEEKKELEPVT